MKKMTKCVVLILALALVLSLAGCASKGIAGTWKCNLDMKKMMESASEAEGQNMGDEAGKELLAFFKSLSKAFEGVNMTVVLDLKEDNTYLMSMDEASVKTAAETLKANMAEVLPSLITEMYGGEEALNAYMEEHDMTMDDMIQGVNTMLNVDDIADSFDADVESGTYRYEDGKLYLTSEEDDETLETTLTVELDGSTLKITDISGETALDTFKTGLPLEFTR